MSDEAEIDTDPLPPSVEPGAAGSAPSPVEVAGDLPVAEVSSATEPSADAIVVASPEAPLVEELGLIERKPAQLAGDAGDAPEVEPPPDAADLPPGELRAVVEGLLFVATKPLSEKRLAACLPGTSEIYLTGFLTGLADRYEAEKRGWELRREAHGWRLLTRAAFHPWVRQLERKELPTKLTKGALETLAVVAYKQPVARGAIEDIRGVQCGPVLRQLMDLKLVAVVGRDDHALGRPLLYGTTDQFLVRFGLGSPADLPKKHEFGDA